MTEQVSKRRRKKTICPYTPEQIRRICEEMDKYGVYNRAVSQRIGRHESAASRFFAGKDLVSLKTAKALYEAAVQLVDEAKAELEQIRQSAR